MNYDKEFLSTFNEFYPFERYILKTPKSINYLFDDAVLLEIFVPATEIKRIKDEYIGEYYTKIEEDDIYVKIQGPAGVMRMAYYDFAEHIRENIRVIVMEDFGQYEWQSLYVEYDDEENDYDDLKELLLTQKKLILEKYGICNIKNYDYTPTTVLKLIE